MGYRTKIFKAEILPIIPIPLSETSTRRVNLAEKVVGIFAGKFPAHNKIPRGGIIFRFDIPAPHGNRRQVIVPNRRAVNNLRSLIKGFRLFKKGV